MVAPLRSQIALCFRNEIGHSLTTTPPPPAPTPCTGCVRQSCGVGPIEMLNALVRDGALLKEGGKGEGYR